MIPAYLPPQNRLEMEVQLIWVAVMNKKEMISCDADFSAVGGNMMHAVISNGIVRWGACLQSCSAMEIFCTSRASSTCWEKGQICKRIQSCCYFVMMTMEWTLQNDALACWGKCLPMEVWRHAG